MRAARAYAGLAAATALVAWASAPAAAQSPIPSQKNEYVVVLDAGHGGKDSGALGIFSQEKDIVLKIAKNVGKLVEDSLAGVKVVYTRTDDTFIPLDGRAKIANDNAADLFVSIHANSSKNAKAAGTETFVLGLHKTEENLEVARTENAVVALEEGYADRYNGYALGSAESLIIFSAMQNAYLSESLTVADHIQTSFRRNTRAKGRGVKQAGFLVLWGTTMPSVLVEVGFISNRNEEAYLNSKKGLDELSLSIFEAIRDFVAKRTAENVALASSANALPPSQERYTDARALPERGIAFAVQLASSSKPIDVKAEPYTSLGDVFTMPDGAMHKSFLGVFDTYDEAKSRSAACKEKFSGAFIVAFENRNKIPVDAAIRKVAARDEE